MYKYAYQYMSNMEKVLQWGENFAVMRAQDNLECLPASHMNVVREVLMAKIMEESTPAKRPRVTNPQLLLFKAS